MPVETLDLWPPPRTRRSRGLVAVGAVALVVAVVAGIVWQRADGPQSNQLDGRRSPTPTPARTSRPVPDATTTAAAAARPRTWRVEPFLADLDLDLFAVGGGQLYRIRTKGGQVTATPAPSLNSSPVSMVVGRRSVLVRDWNVPASGYVVPDGQPAQALPEALSDAQQVLTGPPDRLWVTTARGNQSMTQLTDYAGRAVTAETGPSQYRGLGGLTEDQNGGLLLTGTGGTYQMTADGPRRITRGSVVAVGSRHLLVSDCTATLRCSRYLVSRATGEQRRVGPTSFDDYGEGSLSADGRFAAVWSWSPQGTTTLTVIDLRTNATLARVGGGSGSPTAQTVAWLPDNRLLGVRDGHLVLFDPATRRITRPDLEIGQVDQISVRTTGR